MQKGQVEVIIMYYHEIPNMMKLLRRERADLEEEYCGLRGTPADRLPQGSALGNPTAALAEQAEERGVYERLQEIDIKMQVLSADKALIQGCLDALRGKYKKLIFLRCLTGYSWARTAAEIGVPDTTARRQYKRAVIRLGESLEDMPMAEEILARASRARLIGVGRCLRGGLLQKSSHPKAGAGTLPGNLPGRYQKGEKSTI